MKWFWVDKKLRQLLWKITHHFLVKFFCSYYDKCYIFSWTFIAASLRTDIDAQLEKLDQDFRAGKISGDEYADQRQKLKQTKEGLLDELHRMGVVI